MSGVQMTKQEAEAYLNGNKTYEEITSSTEDSQPAIEQNDSTEEHVDSSATETATVETSDKTSVEEENSTSSDTEVNPEKVETDVKSKKNKQYTEEQKRQHAFAKEKNKRREVQAKLEAKQKEIEELQAKLKKYEGLSKKHFNDDEDAYYDYKVDRRLDQEKIARLQQEISDEEFAAKSEEAAQTAQYRLEKCYPSEEAQAKYQQLISNAETNYDKMHPEIGYSKFSDFLLSEKDQSILSYLQDTDNAPKLIRHFINKPEAALRIMTMRNPYNKIIELKQLENRMLQHERMNATKSNTTIVKRELPNTGKVVTNGGNTAERDWTKPMSKKEAEQWLKSH